ncbi:MAG: MerR family transcriptional regulator [Deltaproteobacteria bacterium]
MADESSLTIGEVARRAGVRPSTLRYYETVGLLEPPHRRGGRRTYDGEVLDVLRLVRLARNAGFTLAEVRRLLHGFDRDTPASERWRRLAERKLHEVEALIERAHRMQALLGKLVACECRSLAECVRPQLVRLAIASKSPTSRP